MPTTCFVSYEIHPTTKGGCGVLLHNAAAHLLRRGHDVVFLLSMPVREFEQFRDRDRMTLPNAERCRAYHVDDLCADFPCDAEQVPDYTQLASLRFAHALERLQQRETLDYVEFFDFCGVAFYALSRRLYADKAGGPVLGVRIHSTLELLDHHGASTVVDAFRYRLYGFERGALALADAVLVPTPSYYERYYRRQYGLAPQRVVLSQSPKLDFPRVSRRPHRDGPCRIVFFGRLFHLKGVDQFVHAAVILLRQRPELRCTFDVIGYESGESPFGGSYTEYLRGMIPGELRERFDFAGHLSHEQVAKRLDDALFAVFPNRLESFCYALHEVYDAGVPVIVNAIPAFLDFFKHEDNALVYDGTTGGLVAAMGRMLDDNALRERLARPYEVADQPLGDFYDRPKSLLPVSAPDADAAPLRSLVVLLCDETLGRAAATLDSLAQQTCRDFDTVCLFPPADGDEELMWWLGRAWRVRDADRRPRAASALRTEQAIVLLRAGDVLDPRWLDLAGRALRRRPDLGFAGSWMSREGRLVPSVLDVVPELYPFEYGPALTRALIRTEPGELLIDLLDDNLGPLGEVGLLWRTVARLGPGRLLPEPLVALSDAPEPALDAHLLQYLLTRYGEPFADRLALLSGILKQRLSSTNGDLDAERERLLAAFPSEQKLRMARDLGGRDLLKIVVRKALRRLGL